MSFETEVLVLLLVLAAFAGCCFGWLIKPAEVIVEVIRPPQDPKTGRFIKR